MNLLEKDEHEDQTSARIKGKILPIRFIPDPFTGESMNVGVCFIDHESRIHTRLLDSFHRLKCLYDNRITESDMKYMLEIVDGAIPEQIESGLETIKSPSINFEFGQATYAAGESVNEVLARMYNDLVTLAVPVADGKHERMRGLDNAGVRKAVQSELRNRMPFKINSIMPESSTWLVGDDKNQHAIDIPIRGNGFLGTVVSACQSGPTVRTNISLANMDIQIARKEFHSDNMGFFIVRDLDHDKSHRLEIDKAIKELSWRISAQGIHLDVQTSPSLTAEHILAWSGIQ